MSAPGGMIVERVDIVGAGSLASELDLVFSSFPSDEVLVEPFLRLSPTRPPATGPTLVGTAKRKLRSLLKRRQLLYQLAPMLTIALSTSAVAAARPVRVSYLEAMNRTPAHHFQWPDVATRPTDDRVTADQIAELDELLAIPVGPELDVHLADWP
jgi:hypothetical protein